MASVAKLKFGRRSLSSDDVLPAAVCLCACGLLAIRLWLAAELPLWLDETWSAMIATRADWGAFWREVWLDCNPPLYYLFLTSWVAVFGDSNLILRLPSIAFVLAAALAPLIWRPRGLNDVGLWTWAGIVLCWGPGAYVMLDARGYGLLLLLSTLSCLVVARLHDRLTVRGATAWVALGMLMFLTHYFAAMLIAGQALVLSHRHRWALLEVWPTGLLAIPGFAWFAYHLPRLKEYARPDVAWYEQTTLAAAAEHVTFVLGGQSAALVLLIMAIALCHRLKSRGESEPEADRQPLPEDGLRAAAVAGAIALVLALAMGTVQASLTNRYLVPIVPAIMLGIVLVTQRFARQGLVSLLLVTAFVLPGLNFGRVVVQAEARYLYGYEEGSDFLAAYRPDRLVFAWDHPAAKILDRGSLAQIGEYFLERDGLEVATTAVVLRETDDPNAILRRAAAGERPAIIWLYNTARRSAARHYPSILKDDPAWRCEHLRRPTDKTAELGAIACIKVGAGDA